MSCINAIDYASPQWEALDGDVRKNVMALVAVLRNAPDKGLTAWMQREAKLLGMSYPSFRAKYYELQNNGGDPMLLADKRKTTPILPGSKNWAGMIPTFALPGERMPGQFGPISRTPFSRAFQ